MVGRVTAGKSLPAEVLEQILAKTDGVPLFVEELTKTVIESGLLRDQGDCYELAGPLPPLAIPATLQDSLMARLDRLARVKELAQMAACIGREFSHELLRAVSSLSDSALRDALAQLLDAELVFRRGAPSDVRYSFKHALVQDAARESLLKSKRQHIHARIATVLEEGFPAVAETEPETLAQHLGGLPGSTSSFGAQRPPASTRTRFRRSAQPALFQTERPNPSRLGNGPGRRIQRRRDAHAPECQGAARIGSRLVSIRYLCMLATTHLQQRAAEDGLGVIAEPHGRRQHRYDGVSVQFTRAIFSSEALLWRQGNAIIKNFLVSKARGWR